MIHSHQTQFVCQICVCRLHFDARQTLCSASWRPSRTSFVARSRNTWMMLSKYDSQSAPQDFRSHLIVDFMLKPNHVGCECSISHPYLLVNVSGLSGLVEDFREELHHHPKGSAGLSHCSLKTRTTTLTDVMKRTIVVDVLKYL